MRCSRRPSRTTAGAWVFSSRSDFVRASWMNWCVCLSVRDCAILVRDGSILSGFPSFSHCKALVFGRFHATFTRLIARITQKLGVKKFRENSMRDAGGNARIRENRGERSGTRAGRVRGFGVNFRVIEAAEKGLGVRRDRMAGARPAKCRRG